MSYEEIHSLLVKDESSALITHELVGFNNFVMDTVPSAEWKRMVVETKAKYVSGVILESFPEHVLRQYVARYEIEKGGES
jgi:hypothetical protein